jgi:hypothetical protein
MRGQSRYGEWSMSVPVIGLLGHCPRAARAPGASNASQGRAGFFPSRVFYPPHSRHTGQIVLPIHALAPAAGNPQRFSGRRRPRREPAQDADRPAGQRRGRMRHEAGIGRAAEGGPHHCRRRSRHCRIAGLRWQDHLLAGPMMTRPMCFSGWRAAASGEGCRERRRELRRYPRSKSTL